MTMKGWTSSILLILVLALAGAGVGAAGTTATRSGAEPIESFYGSYEGTSISATNGDLGKRDLAITIVPRKKGFNLTWTTVTHSEDLSAQRKTYSIDFVPTQRCVIYASAMRTDMFGNRVPLNPLEGDPFVWATIRDKTLSVYALMITPAGGYEMQTYHRTLTEQGMYLEFSRVRDGVPLRFITGELRRVDG